MEAGIVLLSLRVLDYTDFNMTVVLRNTFSAGSSVCSCTVSYRLGYEGQEQDPEPKGASGPARGPDTQGQQEPATESLVPLDCEVIKAQDPSLKALA